MKMVAVRYPWVFKAIDRAMMVDVFHRDATLARGVSDELTAYGLPCMWMNLDTGSQVFVRVVRDSATDSIDASVLVWVQALGRFVDISDGYLAVGVALVTAAREPELLRVFSLRIIAAVNGSLGGGAPLAELTLRV